MVYKITNCSNTALLIAFLVIMVGCEEKPPDTFISQFDRPQDVAFVCYDAIEKKTHPLDCCKTKGNPVEGICDVGLADARIYAFVTQTTPGEVAVVDLKSYKIIDQDPRIPYNSFIPVGGQPNDIAAAWDGQKLYTANWETGDLSVINVVDEQEDSVIEQPVLSPATSINLEGHPAARIVLSRFPTTNRDCFAFVTQPTVGRLAVVAFKSEDGRQCPKPVHNPEDNKGRDRLLGYLRIDALTGEFENNDSDETQEFDAGVGQDPDGARPWAIVASDLTPSIYLSSSKDEEFILEIDSEILVHEAMSLEEPGPLSGDAVVRRIETPGYTTHTLALEPQLERWLYAIENEDGGIIAIDLEKGEMVQVYGDRDTYLIDVPGRARSLAMVRLGEDCETTPGPGCFIGTFAVVSTTTAEIFIIDVDDENPHAQYPHDHSMRSDLDLSPEAGLLPTLGLRPALLVKGEAINEKEAPKYAYFEVPPDGGADSGIYSDDAGIESDAGVLKCEPDGGNEFGPRQVHGFKFRCDPRKWSREHWTLAWEGPTGIRGAAALLYDHPESKTIQISDKKEIKQLVVADETKNFCESGLNVGMSVPEDYRGDLFVITSPPEPGPIGSGTVETCADYFGEGELIYRVAEVIDEHTIIIDNSEPINNTSALPDIEAKNCFNQAISYEIRAFKHWVLFGSESGNLYDGEIVDGGCVVGELEAEGRTQRVFPGVPFENYYFNFTLDHGSYYSDKGIFVPETDEPEEESESEEDDSPTRILFQFSTELGFDPISYVIGNNITDLAFTPDMDLVLVDQDREGLILFDIVEKKGLIGRTVN
ncbi:MAG: hypothetical protein GY847_40355 [Proteobacteria bacterium]|nr:hypothetical protein [Pseudomonadota bacterium]